MGAGDFFLCKEYSKFQVNFNVWASQDPVKKRRHFRRFLRQPKPFNLRTVLSTDGRTFEIASTNAGKKENKKNEKQQLRQPHSATKNSDN